MWTSASAESRSGSLRQSHHSAWGIPQSLLLLSVFMFGLYYLHVCSC